MREWVRRTTVSSPSGVNVISTAVDCGPTPNHCCSQPHVSRMRCGGSTSTNCPSITDPPMVMGHRPPGRGFSVASEPIQRTIRTGSVKCAKTVSGRAATRTSCSTTSVVATTGLPLLALGGALERLQATGQYVGQEAVQLVEAFRAHAVQAPRPGAPLVDQPDLLEHAQVLGDGRLGHQEARGDVAGAQLAAGQQAQDLAALGLRDGLEDLHARKCSTRLYKRNYATATGCLLAQSTMFCEPSTTVP